MVSSDLAWFKLIHPNLANTVDLNLSVSVSNLLFGKGE